MIATRTLGIYLKLTRRYGLWQAEIDPQKVVYRRRKEEWPAYVKRWPVLACPGDWDLSQNDYPPFRLEQMQELFQQNLPYQETQFYRRMRKELAQHGRTHAPKLTSEVEIEAYFERLRTLYESMRDRGFQPRNSTEVARDREITVRIGRCGTPIKSGEGTHRLALARLLEVKRVPVVIDLVHTKWVKEKMKQFDTDPVHAVTLGLAALSEEAE